MTALLGGDFNMMMSVSFDGADSLVDGQAAIAKAARDIPGLQVTLRPTRADAYDGDEEVNHSRWRRILLHGTDFPGLVHQMTSYLGSEVGGAGVAVRLLHSIS